MNCPICNVSLLVADRQGIEVDYCPTCRGVWLDRGELDKLIERSGAVAPPPQPGRDRDRYRDDSDVYPAQGYQTQDRGHQQAQQPYPKKRGSFLSELFDFG